MSTIAKNEKSVSGDPPSCGKARGNRLARRARSFKEDFLEILSQMRSSGGSAIRSSSPCSPKVRAKITDITDAALERNPSKDLECNIKQAQLALKHFRDVVNKNKLEMLPGNGTVVLETVTAIHVLLKKYVLNEQSSTLVSATNQVYQSVARLIKLCDDYLLIGEKAFESENVSEIVNLVEDAIHNIVSLTKDKIIRSSSHKLSVDTSAIIGKHKTKALTDNLDLGQRNSLPDIPLTPREREILARTSAFVLDRHSQSTENVLGETPPPKPPHPDRMHLDPSFPPPLPPKKRQKNSEDLVAIKNSMECLSLRSKSPEDSSSLLSASAGSLDSVLNHCREENDETARNHSDSSNLIEQSLTNGCLQNFMWNRTSTSADVTSASQMLLDPARDSSTFSEIIPAGSESQTESGFASMFSGRCSFQSCSVSSQQFNSTKSSQQSFTSEESQTESFPQNLVQVSFTSEESQTENGAVSNSESSQQFQSITLENIPNKCSSQKILCTTSENVSYHKKYVTKSNMNTITASQSFWTSNDLQSEKFKDIPSCHHEVKLLECPLHASFSSLSVNKSTPSDDGHPPALPEKVRSRAHVEHHASPFDKSTNKEYSRCLERNCYLSKMVVEDDMVNRKEQCFSTLNTVNMNNMGEFMNLSSSEACEGNVVETKMSRGYSEQINESINVNILQSMDVQTPEGKPPPLPPKKKHIMAYMEIFGNASHANANEFLRHSVHAYSLLQSEWQQHQKLLTSAQSCSFTISSSNQNTPVRTIEPKHDKTNLPPALPPKKRSRLGTNSPPQTPNLILEFHPTNDSKASEIAASAESLNEEIFGAIPASAIPDLNHETSSSEEIISGNVYLLDKLNVSDHLVMKKPEDEGPDIRGGHPDALLIHATKAHKNDFLYQEAFLTTYRTFVTPLELIQKLCYRYEKFSSSQDISKQRAARESFSLLVRVVSDLTLTDLEHTLLQTLMDFVQQLLCRGDLTMAKALRVIMLRKYEAKKLFLNVSNLLPSHSVYTRQSLLLDFKSEQIAEQMTLLDAELFVKIEIPEVLIWAQEQNEERSPNLTKFTEHFNKMSYWARSRILEQNDAKDREKYVMKFIKIMKHLRKINNFNSYLALLSALDSAPVRRLEWQKHITEGLKEYCALIDSSSSFRAYRQALAETHPPCIPYIGLVLQDLTFVHIGNTNYLPSGGINFSKRWQQFNIVENMKRFKKGGYPYKKNDRIIAFFNGFDDSLSEEAMWQISEKIKPRGGKKT